MEYVFKVSQLEILNCLIFDASIDLVEIENLKLIENVLEFKVERRNFEDVTRKKNLFGVRTFFKGSTTKIRVEHIAHLEVSGLTEENKHNHFINEMSYKNESQLETITISGLIINMNISEKTRIILNDLHESNFGSGIVWGKSGFTKREWAAYLKSKNYTINY